MRSVYGWVAGVLLVGVGSAVVVLSPADSAQRYRLAAAAAGDVAQTVSTNGTVDFVNRADVSFGVGGTLAELTVAQGDQVTAGQRLGTVADAQARAAVDAAEADLAEARATLAKDQQYQQESVDSPDSSAGLSKQQGAVSAAQTAASKAIAAAKTALAAQKQACTGETPPDPTPDPRAAPTESAPATDQAPADSAPAADTAACTAALATAMSTQDKVAAAQTTLQRQIDALAATLSEQDRAASPPAPEAPTAATIAADQAAVDRASADLLTAKRSLTQATLTAPITGTVASVTAAPGDQVTAADPVLVLIGPGAALVETTIPVDQIDTVEVGQRATVTPTGSATSVEGTVTRIGRLVDASADPAAYPVTVTVEEPPAAMPAGTPAGVDIVISTATDVLTVPTSAISKDPAPSVTILAGTETTVREVELGAVGRLRTEIRAGLTTGDQVVLADLDAPLPTEDQPIGPRGGIMPGQVIRMAG
ncbi:efflux RND transporter periplasmic adaptor subunit [Actinophytocola sediminis]